jgi:hypothetical protein
MKVMESRLDLLSMQKKRKKPFFFSYQRSIFVEMNNKKEHNNTGGVEVQRRLAQQDSRAQPPRH